MTRKERAIAFSEILSKAYPDASCSLNYSSPFELLAATMLSAQCTDARVNIVTKTLFKKYPDVYAFKNAKQKELEKDIHSIGFYHNKAKNLINCAKKIADNFGGEVPCTMDALLTLDGVGRKTANLVLGDIFGKGGMVIDTHAKRILYRVGLTKETDPEKVERDTQKLLPIEKQSDFCHRLVLHGRAICTARKAYCEDCPANTICQKRCN